MTFKDGKLNSMTFQALKIKFLNSRTLQVFHDLYEPWSLGHKTETLYSTSMFQHHLLLEWNLKWPLIFHCSIYSAFLQFYMCESNPSTSGKRQACNPHRDVLSSSLSHFHWKSFTHNHLFQACFVYAGTHYTAKTKLFLTTLASYNKTRAGSNKPTRAPSKYILL